MNEPFEQKDKKQGNKAGLIIVLILLALVLVLGALVGIRLGLPAFQKWKNGGQEETVSREESSGDNAVAVVGAESSAGSSAAEKPPIILPGIKTEKEAAESAALESAATETAAAESAAAESAPAEQPAAEQQNAAAPGTAQPAAEAAPEQAQPAAKTAAQEPAPALSEEESLKNFVAGYWECELTNEEKPYLYLYFSPDYSYKMGFKSDQRLTTSEIAKSFKQEITSTRMEGEWLVIDAFFIDGDLHTVYVKRDGDCIIYRRITGDEPRLTRMEES